MQEHDRLAAGLRVNVKGITQFGSGSLERYFAGVITADFGNSGSKEPHNDCYDIGLLYILTDPLLFQPLRVNHLASIHPFVLNVDSNMRVKLFYTPDYPTFIPALEEHGEYVRDTAIVNIRNNDGK